MTNAITICADDYALSESISWGILELAQKRRISAISCMTESGYWPEHARALDFAGNHVTLGLHFNLTEGLHSQDITLRQCINRAISGRIDRDAITRRLHQQLDRFEHFLGRTPDFVDGHQHVHTFPGIRRAVFATLQQRYGGALPALRQVAPLHNRRALTQAKQLVIGSLQAGFRQQALSRGFRYNQGFAGVYSFRQHQFFPSLMAHWLEHTPASTLIMCHPADNRQHSSLPTLDAARQAEFDFLGSDNYIDLLVNHKRTLQPFNAKTAQGNPISA